MILFGVGHGTLWKEFMQGVREAEPSTKYILKTLMKRAAKRWKEMPEADKAPYIQSANEAKAKKPKEKRKTALPIFRSRCSPKKLGELNKKLTNNQRKAIERLGFGSLLNVQCNMFPRDFIWKLVEHFNPKTRTLEFGRLRTYEITTANVARALGLKLGGFVLDWLIRQITMYKNRGAKATKKAGKIEAPGVGGCVLLLMLLYFDKEPMGMTVGQEGGPLIECWTQQHIQERIGKEENLELLDPTLSQFPQPCLRHPVIAIDPDREAYEVGLPFIRKAGVENKINYIQSDGMIILSNLLSNVKSFRTALERLEGEFDFAFVDADKENYINYHELLLKLVKVGGIIAYDNTLWQGRVAHSEHEEVEDTYRDTLRKVNSFLASDSRIDPLLVSIADGLTLCRRLR
ncbi:hypothetical protein RHGRI_033278 [Rhododendron griersonianum]|uniref:Caffeoyl-CoA O-methyltransferase n=1 Tax=Rhododendron griersonianum TaxID=479676 RepID=A0AAV6HW48_9ERIC|nr:hypothetical protein RHGRI_033278 [Rhododendron griersonianum]